MNKIKTNYYDAMSKFSCGIPIVIETEPNSFHHISFDSGCRNQDIDPILGYLFLDLAERRHWPIYYEVEEGKKFKDIRKDYVANKIENILGERSV